MFLSVIQQILYIHFKDISYFSKPFDRYGRLTGFDLGVPGLAHFKHQSHVILLVAFDLTENSYVFSNYITVSHKLIFLII